MLNVDGDIKLIQRIANRDSTAAAELFDRYADDVFALAARSAGCVDAEDVLQEVFSRALRSAANFRGESGARTWLHAITRFTLYERGRAQKGDRTFADAQASGPGPETFAIGRQDARNLVAALERLPSDQAIVLALHDDGLSHEEIGQRLGIKTATSRKRLQRALDGVRRQLPRMETAERRHSWLESWRASMIARFGA